jgi:hypothetical protein
MNERAAAQLFTEAMGNMRRVLDNDRVYLAMLKHVEGWMVAQQSWLSAASDLRIEHRLTIMATCPMNGKKDVYQAIVRCTEVIPVERINEEAAKFKGVSLFQEALTKSLAETLGCEVETVGTHSGVQTRVVCNAATCVRSDGNNAENGSARISLPLVAGSAGNTDHGEFPG